jgi:proline dehydrogenase
MSMINRMLATALPHMPRTLVGKVSSRYIAGENLEDAMNVVQRYNDRGVRATVDVLGEFVDHFAAVEETVQAYLGLLDELDRRQLRAGVSIKLTAFGLLLDAARCREAVTRLVDHAATLGRYVRVDMEDSPVTDATFEIYRAMRARYERVGIVIQAYLRRTQADAARLAAEGADVRLCKGIYVEPQAVAWKHPQAVRSNYTRALEILLCGSGHVAIATHDEPLVWDALDLIQRLHIPPERYEFQALLGVAQPLIDTLIEQREPVRIYVPFGKAWFAYATRRLRENPAIVGHVTRDLLTNLPGSVSA